MGLFGGPKTKSYLGIDIGVGGAKLVELLNVKGRAKLMTYAYHERRIGEQGKPLIDQPQIAAKLLSQLVSKAGVTTMRAVSRLPQHAVFSTVISVPKTKDEKQLKILIDGQLAKLTPLPLSEMILDSKVIDLSAEGLKIEEDPKLKG